MQLKEFFYRIDLLDKKMISAVALRRHSLAIFLFKIFTESARGYLWLLYAVVLNFLLWSEIKIVDNQVMILRAMFAPLLAWFIGRIVKKLFKRKRPVQGIADFAAQTHSPMDDSFPSLHAASSFSFALTLHLLDFPHSDLFLIWSLLVIMSRFYLGVHYLSDLLGGVFLGLFSAFAISFFL